MSAANKALIEHYVEAWNTGNLALMDALLAPNVACRFSGLAEVNGLEAFKQMAPAFAYFTPKRFMATFGDYL